MKALLLTLILTSSVAPTASYAGERAVGSNELQSPDVTADKDEERKVPGKSKSEQEPATTVNLLCDGGCPN